MRSCQWRWPPGPRSSRGANRSWTRASASAGSGGAAPVRVHVKLDTGMGRLGTRDPDEAMRVAESRRRGRAGARARRGDDPLRQRRRGSVRSPAVQLARFAPFAAAMRERWPGIVVHAANSAATLREPASHFDLVRCGIAIYGCDPMNQDPAPHGLEPALELTSYVAAVKLARAGRQHRLRPALGRRLGDTWVATVPIGYADGIRRGAHEQLRRADRRPALPARGHGQHGQHHGGARTRRRARSAPVIGSRSSAPTATSVRPRRMSRAGSARSTTRSCAGSRAGSRGSITATGPRCDRR